LFPSCDARFQTSSAIAKLDYDISLEALECEEWIAIGCTVIILAVGIGMAFLPGGITATVLMTAAVANAAVTAGGGFVMAISKKICVFFGFKPSPWHEAFLTLTTTQYVTNVLNHATTDEADIVEDCRIKYKRFLAAMDPTRIFDAHVQQDVQDQEFLAETKKSIPPLKLRHFTDNLGMLTTKRNEMDTVDPKTSKRSLKAVSWLKKALKEITSWEQEILQAMSTDHKRIFDLELAADESRKAIKKTQDDLEQLRKDTIAANEQIVKDAKERERLALVAQQERERLAKEQADADLAAQALELSKTIAKLKKQVDTGVLAAKKEVEARQKLMKLVQEQQATLFKLMNGKMSMRQIVFVMPESIWGDVDSAYDNHEFD